MFIIAGLGNPGIAYRHSRHNAGFRVLDALAAELHTDIAKRAHRALTAECFHGGQKLILAKPQTYMNLSGEAVAALVSYYKIPIENLIVVYDDIDLPVGALRIRAGGSAGTHNGMRSILACIGGEEGFPRVRIGMGRQQLGRDLAAHVLSRPGAEEKTLLEGAYSSAVNAILLIIGGNLPQAQALYNKKQHKMRTEEE